MNKPLLVITHERSGTHLLINIINHKKNGQFFTIGYIPKVKDKVYTIEEFKFQTYKDITCYSYLEDIVCKSHHQVEFMKPYLDFVFNKYYVIYVEREVKDVLTSYYKFLFDDKKGIIPPFEEWIFMKPDDVGQNYLTNGDNHIKGTDPHILIEPNNYIERHKIHKNGWLEYKDNLLHITYEDILNDFNITKEKIEDYIKRDIGLRIPDINDKNLPNIAPNKGIVGSYKEVMSRELIQKINIYYK